jgi:curved DNA-binding protein CbpA
MKIPATGDLKHYSFRQILTYLNKEEKTGILTLENKNVKKSIYIEDGDVIFASSNYDEDRFGRMLIKAGKITPEQCDESLKLSKEVNRRQGMVLVERGYLTPKDLFHELRHQITEIIYGLFLWENGTFSFIETRPSHEFIKLKISMDSLIQEGLSRKEMRKKEEDSSFIQKVNQLYENIDRLTYYDILEINMDVSSAEIKETYLKMVKDYHPDRHSDLHDSSIKDKLTALFTFINKAYNTLSDEAKRAKYNTSLIKKTPGEGPDKEAIKAEEQFKRGVEEFKKGNLWGASDLFRWATRINPEKPKYWAYLSLSSSKIPGRGKEAEESILKAIQLEPNNAEYYTHLGMIYLEGGMKKRAASQFETALNWDPTNKKAMKELEKLREKK